MNYNGNWVNNLEGIVGGEPQLRLLTSLLGASEAAVAKWPMDKIERWAVLEPM